MCEEASNAPDFVHGQRASEVGALEADQEGSIEMFGMLGLAGLRCQSNRRTRASKCALRQQMLTAGNSGANLCLELAHIEANLMSNGSLQLLRCRRKNALEKLIAAIFAARNFCC